MFSHTFLLLYTPYYFCLCANYNNHNYCGHAYHIQYACTTDIYRDIYLGIYRDIIVAHIVAYIVPYIVPYIVSYIVTYIVTYIVHFSRFQLCNHLALLTSFSYLTNLSFCLCDSWALGRIAPPLKALALTCTYFLTKPSLHCLQRSLFSLLDVALYHLQLMHQKIPHRVLFQSPHRARSRGSTTA